METTKSPVKKVTRQSKSLRESYQRASTNASRLLPKPVSSVFDKPRERTTSKSTKKPYAADAPSSKMSMTDFPQCVLRDLCEICNGTLWKELHPKEPSDVTARVSAANASSAVYYIDKMGTALDPETEEILDGKVVDVVFLRCGDPLYKFKTNKGDVIGPRREVHDVEC